MTGINPPEQTLIDALFDHANRDPNRIALIAGENSVSFSELISRISATAERLKNYGIEKDDRVLIMGPNSEHIAIGYFAVHYVGAIAVPLDMNTNSKDLRFIVEDCEPAIALVSGDLDLPTRSEAIVDFTSPGSGSNQWNAVARLEDNADILYTTGTTGRKKGVLLTQKNIAAAALNISTFIGNVASDLEVLPIPLSHSFGLGRLRSMAWVGNTLALEAGLRNPAALLDRILKLRATGLALVPAGFELILGLTRDNLRLAGDHLRYIEIGSAPIRDETREKLMELLPETRICHHYGLTEASRACFREFHTDNHKSHSVGKPSPNTSVSIVDSTGNDLPTGESDEIVVHGHMTMKQYWKRPDLDKNSKIGGGLRTGDIGYLDDDGYVFLLGRYGDIINIGGLKVAPQEVDNILSTHPDISDCACVGVSDKAMGERIKAFYVADQELDSRQIIAWLRDNIEEYKIPKSYERIGKIPKTTTGKIRRNLLKNPTNTPST